MTARRWWAGAWPRRLLWVLIVITCGAGLSHYRIDNDISRWTPELAGSTTRDAFVIVGFDHASLDPGSMIEGLPSALVFVVHGEGGTDGALITGGATTSGAELLRHVRRALGDDVDRVALAGPPVFRAALDDWSQRGLSAASVLILLIGAIVMAATTRRVRPVVESLIAVFSSQIALVGLIALTGNAMDMVLSMTPPLLMGLGFSFAAHRATRPSVNRALTVSMVTTGVGLALFAFTDFQPIRSFAIWGAVGIVLTWSGVMLVVSPLSGAPHRRGAHLLPTRPWSPWLAQTIVLAGLFIVVTGAALAPGLRLQEDSVAYFPEDARVVRDYRRLDHARVGTLPFEVIVEPATANPAAVLEATDGVHLVVPIGTSADGTSTRFVCLASSDAVDTLAAAQPEWLRWAEGQRVRMTWVGVAAQVHHIGDAVWRTAVWALPAMLVVAGVAAWLVDRRWSSVWISLWVNAFPIASLCLLLGLSGRSLGLPTLMISALAVGIAIDDTLHILIACRRTGSFLDAVRECRGACVGSSIAVAACMLAFALCPFRPTAEFGVLVAIAAIAALIGDMVLLPATAQCFLEKERARPGPTGSRPARSGALTHTPSPS